MKGKVLITDPVHKLLLTGLAEMGYEPDYQPNIDNNGVSAIIAQYVGLIINSKINADATLMDKGNLLRFIGRLGSGLEVMDLQHAALKGIYCFNTPEGNRDAVAEHAMGLLLALINNIVRADKQVRKRQWMREANRGTELGGKTVGIIGYGNTGRAFAQRLAGFGVRIMVYDKYVKGFAGNGVEESTLQTIFEEADIISLHVQLTPETKYMVNADFFKQCKKDIYLINTSRGQVVNTIDLIAALKSGKVLGAALDVLEHENLATLTSEQVNTLYQLADNERVILTPHIAGWTHESKRKIAETVLLKIMEMTK